MTQKSGEYTAKNIHALEGLEAVRLRPGMYIGSTDAKGLHHLVWEVIDNSIDEHLAGYCTQITTIIHPDNSITVSDNGRGIPTGYHEQLKKSALEVVLTVLHAGGKFDKDTYKVSGGLHGVGVSCVNALSEYLKAEVHRDGKVWTQEYSIGKPLSEIKVVGDSDKTGTTITFKPDHTIFEVLEYKRETLSNRIHELSFLNPGLKISLIDERELDDDGQPVREDYLSVGGLAEFVTYLDAGRTPLIEAPIVVKGKEENIEVDVALQYNDGYTENIYSFVNNINTREGGTHLRGLRMALSKVFTEYGESNGYFSKLKFKVAGEDFREGLTAVISVKIPDPQFKGQTKGELGNSEVTTIVSHSVGDILKHYLEMNPNDAKRIMEKVVLAARAREAARAARELIIGKKGISAISVPDKFADCSSRRPDECEVFLVEGESAGGTAKTGRDRNFQAVLPLKGKILNVEKAFEHKIYESEEIKNIFNVLGVRIEEIDGERKLNLDKLRFHKVVIMCDADIDGSHIVTLILTFFFRYMRSLIEHGYIYIAAPPLYLISRGKQQQYCWTEEDRKNAVELFAKGGNEANVKIQRYKGLGEMNADQLWNTTMDPAQRMIKKVDIDDAAAADRTFSMLMGSEVEPRRQFIEANAKYAKVDV
ncbi:MAG: DNA topoisomerase (ATP-hydrolyzing) subunit B [Saprospiraceae bacterium]|jgi:DNA gyrase subunit B|nr:DNA topoisomerase (ATP-hydrolyzing) subunit B [Saprospiraceae bacterium]MBK6479336.1 DNA topoisomerase (ATP-hydrolyzing) subunit B [Saprospiraceae bacterium]MBK6817526.1 DNA topoisomerase (ATP-hydrolyzing) subunit B [Saprospiraceae bacterium]MBK7372918.1 DNA topoisomerase (ATP-hydrolyzing) subunit B [Saprospiraceae bacterium]MBK7439589.1 DNA topoisomerase (ATP-hydrolyzing) subunit B [Saprospiraceae bacterium]